MSPTNQNSDNLYLHDRIAPLGEANIFKTPGYYNWGASIDKDDEGLYHLLRTRVRMLFGSRPQAKLTL